jgi:hypothetical protein
MKKITNFVKNNQFSLSLYLYFMLLQIVDIFAQGSAPKDASAGVTGLQAATTALWTYVNPILSLVQVVGLITGIIGGYKVYQKMNSGEPLGVSMSYSSHCLQIDMQ